MSELWKTFMFLRMALFAYRRTERDGGITYFGHMSNGVCDCAIFVAVGREAWRVSELAIEQFPLRTKR